MSLDFDVLQEKGGARILYDRVWVRVHKDTKTYFATGVGRSPIGPTTFVAQLPDDAYGEVTLSVRFEKAGESFAEAEFLIPINPSPFRLDYVSASIALVLGLFTGALGMWIFRRKYEE